MAIPTHEEILAVLQGQKPSVPSHDTILKYLPKPQQALIEPTRFDFSEKPATTPDFPLVYVDKNAPADVQEGLRRVQQAQTKPTRAFGTSMAGSTPAIAPENAPKMYGAAAFLGGIEVAAKIWDRTLTVALRPFDEYNWEKINGIPVPKPFYGELVFGGAKEAFGATAAPYVAGALSLLDPSMLYTGPTSKAKLIKDLINEDTVGGIMKILVGRAKIPHEVALPYAEKMAPIRDYASMEKGVDSLHTLLSTTKKTADDIGAGLGRLQKLTPPPTPPHIVANAAKVAEQLGIKGPEQQEPFEGFSDISTKILDDLKGRTTISKQYLLDASNRPELKQAERDILRQLLKDEGETINAKDFANKMKAELLPLERVRPNNTRGEATSGNFDGGRYEGRSLSDELRGPVANYSEHIYNSPIKTSAGEVHFGGSKVPNYFAHTRIEDLPPDSYKAGEFAPAPGTKGGTRRVIELQSDLMQKGRLAREEIIGSDPVRHLPEKEQKEFKFLANRVFDIKGAVNKGAFDNEIPAMERRLDILREKAFKAQEAAETARKAEVSKLEPYRNTWHERVIREEIKQAAKDGKTKLQFPTGETAMKIEGLGDTKRWYNADTGGDSYASLLNADELKVGQTISESSYLEPSTSRWIITNVLGDGKFKAVPKSKLEEALDAQGVSLGDNLDKINYADRHLGLESDIETFDISGKVDKENPIYKFYEKEVGRYLTNKYDAKLVTDPQGVTWWEVNVPKSLANAPVHAFGAAAGIQTDEKGNIKFDPTMALLGIAGFTVARNPNFKRIVGRYIDELSKLAKGTEIKNPKEIVEVGKISATEAEKLGILNPVIGITRQTIKHIVESRGAEKARILLGRADETIQNFDKILPNIKDKKVIENSYLFVKQFPRDPKVDAVITEVQVGKNGLEINTIEDKSVADLRRLERRVQEAGRSPITKDDFPSITGEAGRSGRAISDLQRPELAPKEALESVAEKGGESTGGLEAQGVPEEVINKAAQDWETNYAAKYAELDTAGQIKLEQEFKDKWEPLAKPQAVEHDLPDVPGIETPADTLASVVPPKERSSFGSLVANFFQNPSKKATVHLLDYFKTPEFVLEKLGLGKEAKMLHEANDVYRSTLKTEITKVGGWMDRVKESLKTKYRMTKEGEYVEDATNGLTLNEEEASRIIFRYLDGDELGMKSQMNPEMYAVAREIRAYLEEWADRLKLPKDARVSRYITRLFDTDITRPGFEETMDPELAAIMRDKVAGSVYDPFLQRRLGMRGYKEDVWGALDAYVKRGSRKEAFDPALEALDKAAKRLDPLSYEYVKKFSHLVNMRPTELDKLVDAFVKQSPIGGKLGDRPTARVTQKLRQIYYRGFLGLNPASALRNLSQGANTYAKLGEKYTYIGYTKIFSKMTRRDLQELYDENILDDSFMQDRKIGVYKTALQKLDPTLFSMFDTAEKINRGAAYFGAKAKYMDEGMSEQEAVKAAKRLVRETQFAFGRVDTPVALNQDIVKVFTQLGTYNIKQIEFLSRMVKNKEFAGLIRYTMASLAFVYSIGQVFGMTVQQLIPSIGLGNAPAVSTATNVATLLSPATNQKDRATAQKKAFTGLLGLIPGGLQAKKTFQGGQAMGEGKSIGPIGKTQYNIAQTPSNFVRALLFGKSALPEAQESFNTGDELRKGLDEQKSDSAQLGLEAEKRWEELKELRKSGGPDAVRVEWEKIAKENPLLLDRIKQTAKDEELGLDSNDRMLKMYGVANGMRAQRIAKEINALKTKEEKQALWRSYVTKKILTPEVQKQVEPLLKKAD